MKKGTTPEPKPIKAASLTKNLKERLFQKGFHQGTLPSVKRNLKTPLDVNKQSTPVLAINLNNYKTRQQQVEVPVLKQQSTVFQEMRMKRDSSREAVNGPAPSTHRPHLLSRHEEQSAQPTQNFTSRVPSVQKMARSSSMRLNSQNSQRGQRPDSAQQKGLPSIHGTMNLGKTLTGFNQFNQTGIDNLIRVKTANFNESQIRKTKYLVDKISGKFNIDKRYLNQSRQEQQPEQRQPAVTIHKQEEFVSTRPQTKLDKYIELVLKDVANVDEFIYLKKAEGEDDPYDLRVIDYASINDKIGNKLRQYFTISKKGLCHYVDGRPIEFIKLNTWLAERNTYDQIKALKFFTKFRKWKTLKMWKRKIMRDKINRCSEALQQKLFILSDVFRPVILEIRSQTVGLQDLRIVTFESRQSLRSTNTYDLDEFMELQEANRSAVRASLQDCSSHCRKVVESGFNRAIQGLKADQDVMRKKQEEVGKKKKVKSSLQSNREAAYEKLGFTDNMEYEMRSRLRQLCCRFIRFTYLTDFVTLSSIYSVYNSSLSDLETALVKRIEDPQTLVVKDARDRPQNQTIQPLFIIEISPNFKPVEPTHTITIGEYMPPPTGTSHIRDYHIMVHTHLKVKKAKGKNTKKRQPGEEEESQYEQLNEATKYQLPTVLLCRQWLMISPNAADFYMDIMTTLNEGLSALQSFERWSRHADIAKYINVLEEWDDKVADDTEQAESRFLNPQDMIDTNDNSSYRNLIRSLLEKAFYETSVYIEDNFQNYLKIFWENLRIDFSIFTNQKLFSPAESIQYSLESLIYQKDLFAAEIPALVDRGLLRLNTQKLKEALQPNPTSCLNRLYEGMPGYLTEQAEALRTFLTQATSSLNNSSSNIDHFVKQTNSMKQIGRKLHKIKQRIAFVNQTFNILEYLKGSIAKLPKDATTQWKKNVKTLLQAQTELDNAIFLAEQNSEKSFQRFSKEVTQILIPNLSKEITKVDALVQEKKYLQADLPMETAIKQLTELDLMIKKLEDDGKRYSHYQITLGLAGSKLQNLQTLRNDLNNRLEMWRSLSQWKELTAQWINGKFEDINTEEIKAKSEKYTKIVNKCIKNLPPNPILDELKTLLNTFKDTMPVVIALRNPTLQDYHWKQIKSLIGVQFVIDKTFTLKNLISLGFDKHQDDVIEISTQARQEAILKNQIQENRVKWVKLQFQTVPYKPENPRNKDAFVLTNIEDLYSQLDDLLANFSNILGNRYLKRQRAQAEDLQKVIFNAMLIIDDWLVVQKNWIYLENIFSSSDIKVKLSEENAKFDTVNKGFRAHMRTTSRSKLVSRNLGAHETWIRYKETLAQIQKALENYLQDKRNDFPRFYFLSNDELIEILAKATDIEAIQRNIRKCFECVAKLQFVEDSRFIQAVTSTEGELLKLWKNNVGVKGQIEVWLKNLEIIVDETLRKLMVKGYTDYEQTRDRVKFIESHHCQITLTICQIFWCLDCQSDMQRIGDCLKSLLFQLNQLTGLIRTPLNPLLRKTLVALITQQVHNRDITQKLYNSETVVGKNDFQWQQQLRYYFEGELSEGQHCVVRQVNAQIKYGYQYLGVMSRLVITPLTDRCWMTITGALNIKLGAAPAGPAGTGKTESTKDLAKGLGMLCVVFNCSQQIEYKMMGRLFAGLAQQGAWSCLDQFNRIDIEVLSVIAQQVLTIRVAMLQGKTNFIFGQRDIKLRPNCGVFITMNPGYAGRTQLPDNLKVLFRPVSMMIPDYRLIAEIMLFAQGFEEAKALSKKMVQLYKLSSQQLSQQDHYDFGMRAVKSVLVMAGSLKRADKDSSEEAVLIRAMRDSNIPKFLKEDLPLFNALIKDLFPNSEIKQAIYEDLETQIRKSLLVANLQVVNSLVTKTLQLFDTFNVRFGVMIVGFTTSGKTTCYQMLAHSMTELRKQNSPNPTYQEVKTHVINPKAISMGQLYGQVNELTQQWSDGLASNIMRSCVEETDATRHWVVFDGPVDALWIENMNTVLDDNMMLCLANGERIKLRPEMKMLFEVNDLRVASPATVSRCGMVYMIVEDLGWRPYVLSWMERSLKTSEGESILSPELQTYLFTFYFERCVEGALKFIRSSKCSEAIQTADLQLVVSLCNIMQIVCSEKYGFKIGKFDRKKFLGYAFTFSFIWSFCVSANGRHHQQLSNICKSLIENVMWPNNDDVQNFFLDVTSEIPSFVHWSTRLTDFSYNREKSYHQLYVQTLDSLRYSFVIDLLSQNKKPVFITGGSGTGKSIHLNRLPCVPLMLTSTTSPYMLQLAIESKLQKIKKNLLGGKAGEVVVVAIDDTNMPDIEEYGAMPPVEVLRTIVDKHGVWDRKERFWKNLINTVLVCACASPGGGRNPLPPRLTRHFNMFCLPEPSEQTLSRIFKSILQAFLAVNNFHDPIRKQCDGIVRASIQLYQKIKKDKLPIPSKFHYTFNLRDLSKIFQGLLQMKTSTVRDADTFAKLWFHEIQRVFKDRLNTSEDHEWFHTVACDLMQSYFRVQARQDKFYFTDMMKLDSRQYEMLTDLKKLSRFLDQRQEEYNSSAGSRQNLVFFQDCMQNILRISRILRLPRGNALLIGVAGSGKQSLTRLSSFINDCYVRQVEITKGYNLQSFRTFLKDMMRETSDKNIHVTFLFTDNQIINEVFLEDINNILNSGEVPNILTIQEKDQIISNTRAINAALKRPEDPETIYRTFVERVRDRLHVVLSMSPVGDALRIRCRKFPALVDCCTINWFFPWPREALLSVARTMLDGYAEFPLVGKVTRQQTLDNYSDLCMQVHTSAEEQAVTFQAALKRKVYTTPKSYLDMLKLFIRQLQTKSKQYINKRNRLSGGLDKLKKASVQVAELQVILKDLQPELEKQSVLLAKALKDVQIDSKKASDIEAIVSVEADEVSRQKNEVQILAEQARDRLRQVEPELERAKKAVETIDKKALETIRSYPSPPAIVATIMEGVCILFGIKGDWQVQKKLLVKLDDFITSLKQFDKDNIPPDRLVKLRAQLQKNQFKEDVIIKKVREMLEIAQWCKAIEKYSAVAKEIEPKKKKMAQLQLKLDEANKNLAEKMAVLNKAKEEVLKLRKETEVMVDKKNQLEANLVLTRQRLQRAAKLITLTKDEAIRWAQTVENMRAIMDCLPADVFASCASISYNGPFTGSFRKELLDKWIGLIKLKQMPLSENYQITKTLGDPVVLRQWIIKGLPSDTVSVENAIFATEGQRWPLLIDPQEQASKWLQKLLKVDKLKLTKTSEPSFNHDLVGCIKNGYPVLMLDMDDTLPAVLDSVLAKEIQVIDNMDMIKFGQDLINYDNRFRLYMTTKVANPNFLPQIFIKVNIINFTVTFQGLQQQLLAMVVKNQREEVQRQRDQNIIKMAEYNRKVTESELNILRLLQKTDAQKILDDVELIETLQTSKIASKEIKIKMQESQKLEKSIDQVRQQYKSVAVRGSVLFFVIKDLSAIDPMYQYSLQYIQKLFNASMVASEPSSNLDRRLHTLTTNITRDVYKNVTRGLFESHKKIFSFLIAVNINRQSKLLSEQLWSVFLRGPGLVDKFKRPMNPDKTVITERGWDLIFSLDSKFPNFASISTHIISKLKMWLPYREDPMTEKLPQEWHDKLDLFEKMLMVKAFRPEKVMFTLATYVGKYLGSFFLESPNVNLKSVLDDSDNRTPVIFVLSPGADPTAALLKLKQEQNIDLDIISLGQGQGKLAEQLINRGRSAGRWVLLQNCHLARTWMGQLQKIVQDIGSTNEQLHENFRLLLTSMPASYFPISTLQNGIKLTTEPPRGIKANLKRSWLDISPKQLESCPKRPDLYHKMLWGLTFFHSIIQERRKFGPLGWNIRYEFNDSDLETSKTVLQMLLNEDTAAVPFEALLFVTGDINYGGRVTDDWDRRLLLTILKKFYNPEVAQNSRYYFSDKQQYYLPEYQTWQNYIGYIDTLPLDDDTEVFGMNENANLTYQAQESERILTTILSMQPRTNTASGKSPQQIVAEMVSNIIKNKEIPDLLSLNKEHCNKELFVEDEKGLLPSLSIVLLQEAARFNRLLKTIKLSLENLKCAIDGTALMSDELDAMFYSLLNNIVPKNWQKVAYPSLKPLASWLVDMRQRVAFMSDWLKNGTPNAYWMPGLFFPQGFLTAVLQSHARQPGKEIPIDELSFSFKFMQFDKENCTSRPTEGVFIHGLFLEGASFDRKRKILVDALKGQLYTPMPIIHFLPVKNDQLAHVKNDKYEVYQCPVYKTSLRAGVLSTTGQSTNFVLAVDIPSGEPSEFWILRGTALLCQLNE